MWIIKWSFSFLEGNRATQKNCYIENTYRELIEIFFFREIHPLHGFNLFQVTLKRQRRNSETYGVFKKRARPVCFECKYIFFNVTIAWQGSVNEVLITGTTRGILIPHSCSVFGTIPNPELRSQIPYSVKKSSLRFPESRTVNSGSREYPSREYPS